MPGLGFAPRLMSLDTVREGTLVMGSSLPPVRGTTEGRYVL